MNDVIFRTCHQEAIQNYFKRAPPICRRPPKNMENKLTRILIKIVIFDRFMTEEQFGWRVMDQCPSALRILNTEDLHFLRKARQEAVKTGIELSLDMYRSDLMLRELASIHRSDVSLMVSDYEVELLQNAYGISPEKLVHLPFYCEPVEASTTSFKDR